MKPAAYPITGTYAKAKAMTTDVQIMTARYAEVASAVSMPVYVDGAAFRLPCRSEYTRFATVEHHELYNKT